ncbi:MAG: ribonuclease PH [Planctomycetes bacterium]|nr:ribonuclease PH [Planctomycetota bacterium]
MNKTSKTKSRRLDRHDGRKADQLRPVTIEVDFVPAADGSCLIAYGTTRVICTASFSPGVPAWLKGTGRGWVTAEYGMLPASTGERKSRPIAKPDSRATEIQRLIGRVMRSVVRMERLGENTITLDCDVIVADGGTRSAGITGAYVALARAIGQAQAAGRVRPGAMLGGVAAVSVGIVAGRCVLDLDYIEDSAAEVDMNVAVTSAGRYVEVQGTAESGTFTHTQLDKMLALARRGCRRLAAVQRQAIAQRR